MKPTTQSLNGSSFWGSTINASINQLTAICGEPTWTSFDYDDKATHEWEMETAEGKPFTIYDWKEYRMIRPDEIIVWHIGGFDGYSTSKAAEELQDALHGEMRPQ